MRRVNLQSNNKDFLNPPLNRRQGTSLVEVTVAFGLTATILASLFNVFELSHKRIIDAESETTALLLAREMMEEILSKEFEEPGTTGRFGRDSGESQTNRTQYDDVDDYDSYGANSPPRDVDGTSLTNYPTYTRRVTVTNISSTNFGLTRTDGSTPFKKIVVQVSSTVAGESDVYLEAIVSRK